MGSMQQVLETILGESGSVSTRRLAFPRCHDIAESSLSDEVEDVYRQLGGVLPVVEMNLRSWDMEFEGIAVELDECLHFNRYRGITLAAPVYAALSGFPLQQYRRYCVDHEASCLAAGGYGKKWSNDSCERQFGPGSPPKSLELDGAPRWKQRAFYDYVKDLSPLLVGTKLVRIAVWDEIYDGSARRSVADVLKMPSPSSVHGLVDLICERGV